MSFDDILDITAEVQYLFLPSPYARFEATQKNMTMVICCCSVGSPLLLPCVLLLCWTPAGAFCLPPLTQHPDKCPGDAAAKGRFQALSVVHSVLSDPERRSLYDETGEVADEDQDASEEGNSW